MNPPLRVWIAAENVSRKMGGEAILPYHYFRLLLVRGIDVHIVTHERSRGELLELFPAELSRLHFVQDTLLQKLFFRLGSLLPRRLAETTFGLATQMITQRAQCRFLRELTGSGCVIHQPVPVAPRFPSLLTGLRVPVIIGPLNGGMDYPPAFRHLESSISRGLIRFGRKLTDLASSVFRGKQEAAVVLVANERTKAVLPRGIRGQATLLPENAVDLEQWQAPSGLGRESPQTSRFLFLGRLVDWKALDVLIDAVAASPELELDVVGEGPMRAAWQAKALALKLAERVRFHGWQSQDVCAGLLQRATALVLPSIYESGGAVVLEAMAAAKPVIATAWGGPTDYLDANCGVLVEPTSRVALVAGFVAAMQRLVEDPELCSRMGFAGQAKVRGTYDWERKIDGMIAIYHLVADGAQGRSGA